MRCRARRSAPFAFVLLGLFGGAHAQSCATDVLMADGFDGIAAPMADCATFPRLGGMLIGDPHNYGEAGYQAQIARLDLAVLGMYDGWSDARQSPAEAVAAIKALNPAILLANYTIIEQVTTDPADSTQAYKREKLAAEAGIDS